MFEQGGQGNEQVEQTDPREAELEKKFTEANAQVVRAQVLAEMMKDPDFAAVARAKAEGRKLVIQEPTEQQHSEELGGEEEDVDLSDPKKMKGFLLRNMDKVVKDAMKQMVEPKFQQVESFIANQQANQAQQSVAAARQKYPDFDSYVQEMQQLNQQHPTLNVDDLYMLARTKKGIAPVNPARTFTERPSSSSARPQGDGRQLQKRTGGIQGLREALRASASQHTSEISEL